MYNRLCNERCKKSETISDKTKRDILRHKSYLQSCNTEWIAFYAEYTNKEHNGIEFVKNHCGQRDCMQSSCMKYRVARTIRYLKPYFKLADHVRHVSLTTGGHKTIDEVEKTRLSERRHVYNFLQRVSRRRKKFYNVLIVEEIKKEPDGLLHLHYHLAFLGYSPHHLLITRIWCEVCGQHRNTFVKYRVKKHSILKYFARRIALAGWGMNSEEYIRLVYRRRMFEVYQVRGRERKRLLILEYTTQFNHETENNHEKCISRLYLGTFPSFKSETIPPPMLYKIAESILLEKF